MGSLLALPLVLKDRGQWRIPATTLALGIYGLFGYHFLLFIALCHAPPVEANLVNYLWPLFMVVLAPLFLAGIKLRALQVVAALLGFGGAAIAILGTRQGVASGGWSWGFLPALASAFYLGQLFAADPARQGLSHRRHRPVRPGVRPALAAVPLGTGVAGGIRKPRLAAAGADGAGSAGLHGAPDGGQRPDAYLEHRLGGGHAPGRGRAGRAGKSAAQLIPGVPRLAKLNTG